MYSVMYTSILGVYAWVINGLLIQESLEGIAVNFIFTFVTSSLECTMVFQGTCLPPMFAGLGSWPRRHIWVEIVVSSLLAPRDFPWALRFSPLLKNQHLQIPIRSEKCPQLLFAC